ncbi:hypothetical protein BN1723_019997, partial [Verticillium longisporum]
ARRDPYGRL